MLSSNKKGFTYVELILAITLLGLVVAFLAPSVSIGGGGLESAVKKVTADLRYAQELSTITNQNHGIQFVAGGAYVLYRQSPVTPIADPLTRLPFAEDLHNFRNVTVSTDLQVEFDAVGRPVLGGGATLTLTNQSLNRSLRIVNNTGLVEAL